MNNSCHFEFQILFFCFKFIEARDCIKECPISCSLPVPEQKVGQEYSNDVQELCWSQPQPSSKQVSISNCHTLI